MSGQCHLLVGPPSSGKSTFAQQLQAVIPEAMVVSTDAIREELFGDETIQGTWGRVEAVLLARIQEAVAAGKAVIYDATNVQRLWRMGLLKQLRLPEVDWVAWLLTTSLPTCLHWNEGRSPKRHWQSQSRQVPRPVIESYYQQLQKSKLTAAEGFVSVIEVDPSSLEDPQTFIREKLARIEGSQRNRQNRYRQAELHGYSRLLDFDRLLHLISLLSREPGLGLLHEQDPLRLLQLLKTETLPSFIDATEEVAAVMAAQKGWLYADPEQLASDLTWLEEQGFLSREPARPSIELPPFEADENGFFPHAYSDRPTFLRLMGIIRFIIHNPLAQEFYAQQLKEAGTEIKASIKHPKTQKLNQLQILENQLKSADILQGNELGNLRKDIERVLHPYGIFPDQKLRKGYYLGSGLLTRTDLFQVYDLAEKQVQGLSDVLARATVQRFAERLRWAQVPIAEVYPVRAIATSSIVNPDFLSGEALASEAAMTTLENDIRSGQQIRVNRRKGAASFGHSPQQEDIRPLQILFFQIAWYLGYEVVSGERKGLFGYERLDRLLRVGHIGNQRNLKQQRHALNQLDTLRGLSAGIFLGQDVTQQQAFLISDAKQRRKLMQTLDLRFTPQLFSFISEGTQRFPLGQMRMSPYDKRHSTHFTDERLERLFSLKPVSQDKTHPYRMTVELPPWSFEDVTLKAWIAGLGYGVKVIGPEGFRQWIRKEHQAAAELYSADET